MIYYIKKGAPDLEKRYTSQNGIEIFGYKNPNLHGFFISLFVRSGSMYESEENSGITHFLEHVSIRNVNKQMNGELYRTLDRLGVEFNASTFSEMVQFYISGASDKFRKSADIITSLFSPIILNRSELDAERRRIKAEIRESDDKSSLLSFTNSIVHKGTSLARAITGTVTSVNKISAKRLEEYRRSAFAKENVFFYLTGNYTDGDVLYLKEKIDSYTLDASGRENSNIAPITDGHFNRQGEVYVKNDDFTSVRFTFDLDMKKISTPECDLIYDMLLSGYNSRFFIEMSELRGLFYDISGAVERYKNIGELYFSYEVRQKDLCDAVAITVDILKKFKKTQHAPGDMMKCGYVDNAYMLHDDARELNFTFAYDNHIMGLGYSSLDERRLAYDSVSSDDLLRAANEIFRTENLTLTLKGDKKKIDTEKIKKIISEL